jgi:hypothetical protein
MRENSAAGIAALELAESFRACADTAAGAWAGAALESKIERKKTVSEESRSRPGTLRLTLRIRSRMSHAMGNSDSVRERPPTLQMIGEGVELLRAAERSAKDAGQKYSSVIDRCVQETER